MEPFEVVLYVTMAAALVASMFLDRKFFFMMNSALFTFWGLRALFSPETTIAVYAASGTPTGTHVVTYQCIGAMLICHGVACWIYRNTSDERVKGAVLSMLAQTLLSELVVFGSYHVTISSRTPEKDEKGSVTNEPVFRQEAFPMIYTSYTMHLLVYAVQYFRSPSVKLPASNHADRCLTVSMSVSFYLLFGSILLAAFSPDVFVQFYHYPIKEFPSDPFLHASIRLWVSLALPHCLFIYSAMDFVTREDKGNAVLLNLMYNVLLAAISVHAFVVGTYPFEELKQLGVFCGVAILNNLLSCWRCDMVDTESGRSKKIS